MARPTPSPAKPGAAAATGKPATVPARIGPAERLRMIEEAAYYRAEKRGFEPGWEQRDWAESEKEIDAMLKKQGKI